MRITVDWLSSAQKRTLRGATVVAGVLGTLGIGVAVAAPRHAFNAGDAVEAKAMNENFSDLDLRITALEKASATASHDGGYSLGATFCGASASKTVAAIGGYGGAKKLCESVSGCGSSSHMCTGAELVRSVALGINPKPGPEGGWFAAGAASPTTTPSFDCGGYTVMSASAQGSLWLNDPNNGSINGPNYLQCNNQAPVFCCE